MFPAGQHPYVLGFWTVVSNCLAPTARLTGKQTSLSWVSVRNCCCLSSAVFTPTFSEALTEKCLGLKGEEERASPVYTSLKLVIRRKKRTGNPASHHAGLVADSLASVLSDSFPLAFPWYQTSMWYS